MTVITFRNGRIFDGTRLLDDHAARYKGARLERIAPDTELPDDGVVDLGGDILAPGYTDLQVNGGGGVLLNDAPSVETLIRIAAAHRGLGTTRLLPTLITDTPETTQAAIDAVASAIADGVPGIAGLHLEGPHLSLARKGAHDAALIRPMEDKDLTDLLGAVRRLPALMVTVAPENVSIDQVTRLSEAGVIVSLGHTDADYETCRAYAAAGARTVTHLFNAMSQLGSREPGLVGAALAHGVLSAGLIADGIHVHPETIRFAWTAKSAPGHLFLVSDAMAVAGTGLSEFVLGGRRITRKDGRLTLEDGTLAGADLDLTRAVKTLTMASGVPLADALAAATIVPAGLIGFDSSLQATSLEDTIRISPDLSGCRLAAPLD